MTSPQTPGGAPKARRWFPHPILSVFLLVFWLLLVNSINPGQLLLGAILAWLIPWLAQSFWQETLRIRNPGLLVKYMLVVLWDVVIANLALVPRILGPLHKLQPAFLKVPLDIEHEFTITIFASTISLTPGTVSADLSLDRKFLLVHSLHETNPEAAIATLKQRYEAPLKEVFECSPQP